MLMTGGRQDLIWPTCQLKADVFVLILTGISLSDILCSWNHWECLYDSVVCAGIPLGCQTLGEVGSYISIPCMFHAALYVFLRIEACCKFRKYVEVTEQFKLPVQHSFENVTQLSFHQWLFQSIICSKLGFEIFWVCLQVPGELLVSVLFRKVSLFLWDFLSVWYMHFCFLPIYIVQRVVSDILRW